MLPLAQALVEAARAIRTCALCGNLDSRDPCTICADPNRDQTLICVVETVGDLWALERARVHHGLYHVLGGTLSALGGTGPDDLNVGPLADPHRYRGSRRNHPRPECHRRWCRDRPFPDRPHHRARVVPGAMNGAAHAVTARPGSGVRVTRVAQGVPIGGALDVLDDGTLATALRARR